MKYVYILLLSFAVILVGCGQNFDFESSAYVEGEVNFEDDQDDRGENVSDPYYWNSDIFVGGNHALNLSFAENMPPKRIKDQGLIPFNIRVELENHGEYSIPSGQASVALIGIYPQDYGLVEENMSQSVIGDLRGVERIGSQITSGGKGQAYFARLSYMGNIISGTRTQTLYANVCYPYETRAIASLCISGNTFGVNSESDSICDIDSERPFASSGAPIKIDNFKQYPTGTSSIAFEFDIIHTPQSNEASLFEPESLDSACEVNGNAPTSASAFLKKDHVVYEVDTGLEGLDCGGTGTNTDVVTLANNRYTVICNQDTAGESEYEKTIQVRLAYDYLERISQQVTIEHIGR